MEENIKVTKKKIKDPAVLYLYYLDSKTDFDDLEKTKDEHIIILNQNNGKKMNEFLEEYIKNRLLCNPELDYEILRMFEELESKAFNMTVKNMLPSDLLLSRFTDKKTLDEISNNYNVPSYLLTKYIKGRKR